MHIGLLVGLLGFVLVAGILWWCITRLVAAFGIPEPLATVIQVVVILILLLVCLDYAGIFGACTGRLC